MKFSEIKKLSVGDYPAIYNGFDVTLNISIYKNGSICRGFSSEFKFIPFVFIDEKSKGDVLFLWTMPYCDAMYCKVHHSKLTLK